MFIFRKYFTNYDMFGNYRDVPISKKNNQKFRKSSCFWKCFRLSKLFYKVEKCLCFIKHSGLFHKKFRSEILKTCRICAGCLFLMLYAVLCSITVVSSTGWGAWTRPWDPVFDPRLLYFMGRADCRYPCAFGRQTAAESGT